MNITNIIETKCLTNLVNLINIICCKSSLADNYKQPQQMLQHEQYIFNPYQLVL